MAIRSTRAAMLLCFSVLACRPAKDPRSARVVARWVDGDITIANVSPEGALEEWQIIVGTNEAPRVLKRYGVSVDGRHVCLVAEGEELLIRPTTSTRSFPSSDPLGMFEVDGCIVDRYSHVLAFWRAGSRIRTFALESETLRFMDEFDFENGFLGGPATIHASSSNDLALIGSPFNRLEAWVSRLQGWQRGGIHVEDLQILSSPGIGDLAVVVALSPEPAVIVRRLTADGDLESRMRIDTPEEVGRIAVAPDDRYAWMWSLNAGYLLDLETMELEEDPELERCLMLTPAAVETTSGYAIVGVRNEEGRRDIGRCHLTDNGRFDSFEIEVPPRGYAEDLALSLQVVFPR